MSLISREAFAALADVTYSRARSLFATELFGAVAGDLIDTEHPAAVRYLSQRAGRAKRTDPAATGLPTAQDVPDEALESLADWSLRELLEVYGTEDRFKTWLQTRKLMVDIDEKIVRNAERRGNLIPRDFVEKHIIGNVDRAFRRLLTDAAQTISTELESMFKAKATREKAQSAVELILSTHIEAMKGSVAAAMRDKRQQATRITAQNASRPDDE